MDEETIDDYFANYYRIEQEEESLESLGHDHYDPAKFDSEGKFAWN